MSHHPVADVLLSKGQKHQPKKKQLNQPAIYERLVQLMHIHTPTGARQIQALFDTGANVFVLDHEWATKNQVLQVQHEQPRHVTNFAGQTQPGIGKSFTPYLNIQIQTHQSTVSCELGTLEPGIQIIIPGGWFLVQHPQTFHQEAIQVVQNQCLDESIIEYDKTILKDP